MGVQLTVEVDTSSVIEMLQAGIDGLEESLTEAMDQAGSQMADVARSIVPVRTGFLRSTIYHEVDGLSLTLTADASYAGYVELGTRYMKAEPYIRPAFYQVYPMLLDALQAAAANAFNQ